MTQEEKDLLLRDLCARLPYGVIVKDRNGVHKLTLGNTEFADLFTGKVNIFPYLRPMSSMTEEEIEELNNLLDKELKDSEPYFVYEQLTVDFYLRHHLDNRLMIDEGLALEATERLYNLEKE